MFRLQTRKMLPLSALGVMFAALVGLPSHAGPEAIGEKGANVYCFMRNTRNGHEVSWDAAYQIIKRQTSSIFKTSPKHAAVMITETVVQNPKEYENCGRYLGDLFRQSDISNLEVLEEETPQETNKIPSELKKGDRYSY